MEPDRELLCVGADKPERRAGSIYTEPFSTDKSFFAGKNASNEWLGRPNAALYGLRGDAVRAQSAAAGPLANLQHVQTVPDALLAR